MNPTNRPFQLLPVTALLAAGAVLLVAAAGCGESPAAADEGGVKGGAENTAVAPATPDPFTGTFHATFDGKRAVMNLTRAGDRVTGNIDDVSVDGIISDVTARGSVVESASGALVKYELVATNDSIEMRLSVTNPQTGEPVAVPPVVFTRRTAEQLAAEKAAEKERDGRLVGHWRHTYTRVSGGISIAIDYWLWLEPDGTCTRFSNMAGGGVDIGFEGAGDRTVGRWKTADKALYTSGSPDGEPRFLGRYQVSDGTMLLTYNNGDKEIWERQ